MFEVSTMKDFLVQIKKDMENIQNNYIDFDPNVRNEQYAVNYWILEHLFNIDT